MCCLLLLWPQPWTGIRLVFFLGNTRHQGRFTNWSFGTGCAPSNPRAERGWWESPWVLDPCPEHWLTAAPTRGNVRTGRILFGISFYLCCLFQLHCRFLMDSHFSCSFPIIQYTFPNHCRHGLSQRVRHPLAAPFWLRGGPGSPFAAPSPHSPAFG